MALSSDLASAVRRKPRSRRRAGKQPADLSGYLRALRHQAEDCLRNLHRLKPPAQIARECEALERRGHAAAADARRREYVAMVKALSDLCTGALQERRRLGAK